ncbi:hypothetical protein OLN11_32710 [Pseudomonas aeruginosa]|uniref:Uncharacterized protein n=1 Tax=Aquipseudomonas alcaligenes TaxID=43263 RepID=A0AA37FNZ2_AQUAC|nr:MULTISPECIES: hypothetical protein [Pseudomonas aeruginosa group]MDI2336948.1 hypothetical protein [Pseudomonas aeruginosa]BCR26169.1 hypothetical protein KAM426_36960 [Pseudomonas alcaligenes]GIZ69076.1 hypothetical protein KAM428_41610 [Pseudomonas alcaligenes]GIZ73467.1 hypothetical protein KAM429_42280 [Pseudomonas alcaligenes]GIZ77820.1 hypothetical protein KAM430_42290 [Pseudomonas alcaligenes]
MNTASLQLGDAQSHLVSRPELPSYPISLLLYQGQERFSLNADMRNCFIEADAWEEGTERRW